MSADPRTVARIALIWLIVCPALLFGQVFSPLPALNQPLVPDSVAPGSAAFTLTVNGSGFVPRSAVRWNGLRLRTTYVSSDQLMAIVPAANVAMAGPATVVVVNPGPGGGKSNAALFMVGTPEGRLSFSSSTIGVGIAPGNVVAIDFNRDGIVDLAVVNQKEPDAFCYQPIYENTGTISVLAGNGDGTFSPGNTLCFPGGLGDFASSMLAVGDFKGNGRPDLIGAYFLEGLWDAGIYHDKGSGAFASFAPIFGWADAIGPATAVGDFNGDGNLDLAFPFLVLDYFSVAVLYGDGSGGFNVEFAPNYLRSEAIVAGDFNGDGIPDIVSVFGNSVTVLLGSKAGTLTQLPTQTLARVTCASSVATGDFDGDGILDLAIADGCSQALVVLHGNGDGTFTRVKQHPRLYNASNYVATADLDGDGVLDLIFADAGPSQNTIEIFRGNGDGTFRHGPVETVGNGAGPVAIGDFNGDGRPDIAVVNSADNTVTILLQTPAP